MKKIFYIICCIFTIIIFCFHVVKANPNSSLWFVNSKQSISIAIIGLDKNAKKFTVISKYNSYFSYSLGYRRALTIDIYNKDNDLKKSLPLLGYDKGNSYKLNELESVSYEEGDYIKVNMVDNSNIYISFNPRVNYWDITNISQTRFVIKNDSLVAIKELPPIIKGTNELTLIKGQKFEPLKGITARNFLGEDISKKINFKGDIDIKKIGTYNISYYVNDLGLKTTVNRIIKVVEPENERYEANRQKMKKVYTTNNYFKDYKERDNYFRVVFTK